MTAATGRRGMAFNGFAGMALLGTILAACASPSIPVAMPVTPKPSPVVVQQQPAPSAVSFQPPSPPPDSARMQCVTYARAVTGLDLKGDAWRWWNAADGRYERGAEPSTYSVLVLSKGVRLSRGHVAVVREVLDSRRIRVDHANWNNDERIVKDMLVVDVSAANDWTEVKFWNEKASSWGNVYLAYGFIYPQGTEPDRTASLSP